MARLFTQLVADHSYAHGEVFDSMPSMNMTMTQATTSSSFSSSSSSSSLSGHTHKHGLKTAFPLASVLGNEAMGAFDGATADIVSA